MQEKKKYRDLFFDLDKTLWDFEANSRETLSGLFKIHGIDKRCRITFELFHEIYSRVNKELWDQYREGIIDKPNLSFNRFYLSLKESGLDDRELSSAMSEQYIEGVSSQTRLYPGTHEILEYLYGRYRLHIITNGFSEVQYSKMKNSALIRYFDQVITSEEAGSHKPALRIFQYAFTKAGASPATSLMIGDDPDVDLLGARSAGMDQLFVNHEGLTVDDSFTYEVRSLIEIKDIL